MIFSAESQYSMILSELQLKFFKAYFSDSKRSTKNLFSLMHLIAN